ncbi:MAG: outer membrane beta-barrel protein [Bacteroidota bacterium]
MRHSLLLWNFIILVSIPFSSFAQSPFHLHLNAGMMTGTPYTFGVPLPEGASGSPGLGLMFGGELEWKILDRLSINGGIYSARKGSEYFSPITGKYDVAEGILGIQLPFKLDVNYTGEIEGIYNNHYLDFPLYLSYDFGKRFSVGLGYQYSRLLNGDMSGEADISVLGLKFNNQEFDESDKIESADHALLIEGGMKLLNRLDLKLRLNWGLADMMTEDTSGLGIPKNYYLGVFLAFRLI